jgi:hypothetical protein
MLLEWETWLVHSYDFAETVRQLVNYDGLRQWNTNQPL